MEFETPILIQANDAYLAIAEPHASRSPIVVVILSCMHSGLPLPQGFG
jgi:hypothetical protein